MRKCNRCKKIVFMTRTRQMRAPVHLQKCLAHCLFYGQYYTTFAHITNIFGNWLNEIDMKTEARIRIGVSALCWSIWNYRNNIIFNKVGVFSAGYFHMASY
jgi:hypothetical protein